MLTRPSGSGRSNASVVGPAGTSYAGWTAHRLDQHEDDPGEHRKIYNDDDEIGAGEDRALPDAAIQLGVRLFSPEVLHQQIVEDRAILVTIGPAVLVDRRLNPGVQGCIGR